MSVLVGIYVIGMLIACGLSDSRDEAETGSALMIHGGLGDLLRTVFRAVTWPYHFGAALGRIAYGPPRPVSEKEEQK